jgi:hypothetical protein
MKQLIYMLYVFYGEKLTHPGFASLAIPLFTCGGKRDFKNGTKSKDFE